MRGRVRGGLRLTLCAALAVGALPTSAASDPAPVPVAHRIVSLNPSLTAILLALGARDALVGVDDFSARLEESVSRLPRVGGLYSPSLEAVVALAPDRVVAVASVEQRDFRHRLEALDVPVSVFENFTFDEVMANIAGLGAIAGRSAEAAVRIAEVRAAWARAGRLGARLDQPRTLLVLQRDPFFVAGPGSYIGEMLEAVGGVNPAAEFADPYPRVAAEWVLGAAPDVIVDLSDAGDAEGYWSRWPALPAVSGGRVVSADPHVISIPGPYLDRSIEVLAEAVHGHSALAAAVAAEERSEQNGASP